VKSGRCKLLVASQWHANLLPTTKLIAWSKVAEVAGVCLTLISFFSMRSI
jgi:hypothetical protein